MKKVFSLILTICIGTIILTGCTTNSTNLMSKKENNNIIKNGIKEMSVKGASTKLNQDNREKDTVKRVIDGDTFELSNGKKVRLIGVNTPETVKPNSPVEYYGKEASNFTKSTLTGKTVYLEKDAGDTDKYGRLLRYVYLEDGKMFNEILVTEGYASVMTIQPNVKYQKLFVNAERDAREHNRGLWNKK